MFGGSPSGLSPFPLDTKMDKLEKAQLFFYTGGGCLFSIMFLTYLLWFVGLAPPYAAITP